MTKHEEGDSVRMEKKILISIDENETRIALLNGGKLDNLFIEQQGEERIAGSIYWHIQLGASYGRDTSGRGVFE